MTADITITATKTPRYGFEYIALKVSPNVDSSEVSRWLGQGVPPHGAAPYSSSAPIAWNA